MMDIPSGLFDTGFKALKIKLLTLSSYLCPMTLMFADMNAIQETNKYIMIASFPRTLSL